MIPGRWLALVLAVALAGLAGPVVARQAGAPSADATQPQDPPRAARRVRDPEFGVTSRQFGLERHVEMYQWQRTGGAYVRHWSAQPIASADFAPGHDNPAFPLQGQRWLASRVTVDGKPLDAGVLRALGRWQVFRPGFSALPGNLAVTFQPQGDGLGSAENPLDPQIGDLRITWRELVLPPLADKLVLRAGRWQLAPGARAGTARPAADAPAAAPAAQAVRRPWLLGGGLLLVLVAGIVAARRRRPRR